MSQKNYIPNIPETGKKRIVIVGGGFAGLKFVQKSLCAHYQLVLLDKNNYHQFQPLLYQVATAGLEPSAISFPLRKVLRKEENIHYRLAEVQEVFPHENEMKKYIFPKDYPELDLNKMRIVLYEGSPMLLAALSDHSSKLSRQYLEKMGVEVHTGIRVTSYDGTTAVLSDGSTFETKTLIWAAGIKPNVLYGLPKESLGRGGRVLVDRHNRLQNYENIFALGDLALMETSKYPGGHPQVAQTAIQQAALLAKNLKRFATGKPLKDFEYINKGSLATVGRNRAVADLPGFKLRGFVAWLLWSFVHLFTIMGVKNRMFVFLNWSWNYFTYDQSLRLLIKPKQRKYTLTLLTGKHSLFAGIVFILFIFNIL